MDGWVKIGTKLETKDFSMQIKETEKKLKQLEKIMETDAGAGKYKMTTAEMRTLQVEIEKTRNKLVSLNSQQAKLEQANLKNAQKGMLDLGNETSKTIKKVGKLALGIFGLRSAYMFVRQAASTLAGENDKIASDIENIKSSLANALLPVILKIIDWAKYLMSLVNSIWKKFTGKDLFKPAADNLKQASGSAKELKKSLLGFDELNILQDNTSSAGGGVSGGASDFDISGSEEILNNFVETVKSKWQELGQNFKETLENPEMFTEAYGNWDLFFRGIVEMAYGLWEVIDGFADVVRGVFEIIKGIVTGNLNVVWEGIKKLFSGIYEIIKGLFDFIAGIFMTILGLLKGLLESIFELLKPVGNWILENVLTPIFKFLKATLDSVVSIIDGVVTVISGIMITLLNIIITPFKTAWQTISAVFGNIKSAFRSLINVFTSLLNGDLKGAFRSLKDFVANIFKTLGNILVAPINVLINAINSIVKGINRLSFDVPDWVPGIGGKKFGFNLRELSPIRLAVGGIINNPGKGVYLGGAIGGEAGREGVLPLTDNQAMQQLGQEIGKWITLNMNITNEIDGRVLNKKLETIKQNNNFSTNGGI